jgi:hypothetical protein
MSAELALIGDRHAARAQKPQATGIPAPADSPAWSILLSRAEALGCDRQAFRWLLFGVGAHPLLIAHAEVLERVRAALASPVFVKGVEWGSSRWVDFVPMWRTGLANLSAARYDLGREPGLNTYNVQPTAGKHPLMHKGITSAPVAAAMWSRHAFNDDSDPAKRAIAMRFERLQAHLLATHFESRARSGKTIEEFEQFSPAAGAFAPVPVSADAVSRAVRSLSEARHADLVACLPDDEDSLVFADALGDWVQAVKPVCEGGHVHPHALDYAAAVQHYFNHLRPMLDAAVLERRYRRRSSGDHASTGPSVHGYVLVVTPGSDDPANPRPTLATLEPPSTGPDGARNITEDGLAPNDVVAGTLELVDPDAIQGRLSRLKWQQIAAQMAAQDFPWDVDRLGARECRLLMQVARAVAQCLARSACGWVSRPSCSPRSRSSPSTRRRLSATRCAALSIASPRA